MNKLEKWKDIDGYEGIYKVSSLGRVKSLKNNKIRFLKQRDNTHGYLSVVLCKHGNQKEKKVHKLVSEYFL